MTTTSAPTHDGPVEGHSDTAGPATPEPATPEPATPETATAEPTTAGRPSPLVPASSTAERERERLRRAQGRTGPARLVALAVPGIRHLGSAQAAQNGLRYRPVAWTLIALVAVAFHLPGRPDRTPASQTIAAPAPVVTSVPPQAAAEDPPPVPPTPEFTPVAPLPTFPSAPLPAPPSPEPTGPTGPLPFGGDTPELATPLSVRGWSWASRLPVTPLPTDAVADDTVPVANRLGTVERVAFLRLTGDETELVLVEDDDSAREALGPAMVAICPVLDDGWETGPGKSFDEAPAWDTETCVGGVEDDGTWTFDLSAAPDRDADTGFALVPTVEAPADFNIAFRMPDR